MTALLRTVAALLSRRIRLPEPRLCESCGHWVTSISREQWRACLLAGYVSCDCGRRLRPIGEEIQL